MYYYLVLIISSIPLITISILAFIAGILLVRDVLTASIRLAQKKLNIQIVPLHRRSQNRQKAKKAANKLREVAQAAWSRSLGG